MFYKFTIDLQLLLNGNILPKNEENNVYFYELVIKNGEDAILRIPFNHYDKEWKVELYDNETQINVNRIQLSMAPHVVRFDKSKDIFFHAVKVTFDIDEHEGPIIDRIGYATHIKEGTSDIHDVPFFHLKGNGTTKKVPSYFKDFQVFENTEKLKEITELPLHDYGFKSQYWLTQRAFYSTSHVTLCNHVHRENIQLLRDGFFNKYKNYKFPSLLDMLVKVAKVMTKGRIKYKVDKKFAQTTVSTDAGDILIETSSQGDCEDFGHFYMRIFRTLVSIYKYFVKDKKSDMFINCKMLEENYTCFNFICQVKQNGQLEFHSTMMIIPSNIKWQVLSFEVTNPKKSYILPSTDYHEWHNENYFLVDNYFVSKVNKVSLEKIALSELEFFNY